jgi:hypothetical protein
MAKQFESISPVLQEFIEQQHLFFVASAMSDGRVNLSPKGMDTLKVLSPNRVMWLNLTGSGNETAAHLLHTNRITLMFCAFEGKPLILRLYGTAKVYHERDPEWKEHLSSFPEMLGSRQLIDVTIDLVQTSCGFGVPLMDFVADRDTLMLWAENHGEEKLKAYQQQKNTTSIDGFPTGLLE